MKTPKEKFLASALKLFNEKWFENTSTTAICTDAGYSSGALFFHFKTKNDLLDYLFLSIKKKSAKYISKKISYEWSIDTLVREILRTSFHYYEKNYTEFVFMKSFTESKHFSRVANSEISEDVKKFLEILEAWKSKNIFIDEDVNLMFIGINSMIYTFTPYIKKNKKDSQERCVDFIMRSILK